jgi:hypothetical protein
VSFKTDRLAGLFPDVYAAREGGSLLYRLLDATGFELVRADDAVKAVLKSHWVDHAHGAALDGLAGIFGVERRRLADGALEPDDGFRRRLKAVVPYFTGGGTVGAIAGAVRSALGLPYDLKLFRAEIAGPGGDPEGRYDALIRGLEELVRVEEFSPRPERVLSPPVTATATASEVTVEVGFSSVAEAYPRIEWTFTRGGGRRLTLQRLDTGEGLRSRDALRVAPGETVVLTADGTGALRASIGLADVTAQWTAWDGTSAPRLPAVPGQPTQWTFTSAAGTYDLSAFDDGEGFDFPDFSLRFEWTRFQPLTFDVIVPYFVGRAVADLQARTGFTGRLFLFEGLPLEVIQAVVDQTRAAGVRGMVHFSLAFSEDHGALERMSGELRHALAESHGMSEEMVVGNVSTLYESQEMDEAFALGGVFDLSGFDGSFGFQ